jgi:hypothetical protein
MKSSEKQFLTVVQKHAVQKTEKASTAKTTMNVSRNYGKNQRINVIGLKVLVMSLISRMIWQSAVQPHADFARMKTLREAMMTSAWRSFGERGIIVIGILSIVMMMNIRGKCMTAVLVSVGLILAKILMT